MNETSEQRQVLDMLQSGRINSDDAERLLVGLAAAATEDSPLPRGGARAPAPPAPPAPPATDRHLRIVARTEDGDEIDARIPLQLIATGIDFEKLLPEAARDAIEEVGLDLAELRNVRADQLVEAIRDLEVDLEGHAGNSVSLRCD